MNALRDREGSGLRSRRLADPGVASPGSRSAAGVGSSSLATTGRRSRRVSAQLDAELQEALAYFDAKRRAEATAASNDPKPEATPVRRPTRRSRAARPVLVFAVVLLVGMWAVLGRAPSRVAVGRGASQSVEAAFLESSPVVPPRATRSIPTRASPHPATTPTSIRDSTLIAPAIAPTPVGDTPSSTLAPPTPALTPTVLPNPAATPVLVFLDPGHGGVDTGTIGGTQDGTTVEEKTIALAIAERTADHLRADGVSVALSRSDDSLPGSTPADYTPDGNALTPAGVLADLQRRIDRANASGAAVMLSIHLNAFADPAVEGTETFYDSSRPFATESESFATLVQSDLIAALRAHGYDTPDRGVTDDAQLVTETLGATAGYNHLVLLGPAIPGQLQPSEMPSALSEPFFLSSPVEATAIQQPAMQELVATAYTQAIEQFLRDQAVG